MFEMAWISRLKMVDQQDHGVGSLDFRKLKLRGLDGELALPIRKDTKRLTLGDRKALSH